MVLTYIFIPTYIRAHARNNSFVKILWLPDLLIISLHEYFILFFVLNVPFVIYFLRVFYRIREYTIYFICMVYSLFPILQLYKKNNGFYSH